MKKSLIILSLLFVVLLIGTLFSLNLRSVYFVDGSNGEITKLTSVWLKQNEIEIKDRWFNNFDKETVSGVVYIEDSKEYALIPYTYTNLQPKDDELGDFYYGNISRVRGVEWIEKQTDQELEFSVTNEQRHSIAVGTYSGTSYDETEYGKGIYSIPVYDDKGNLQYHLQFPTNSLAEVNEGFNDDLPCYILQEFMFTELSLMNHNEVTFLLAINFIGGLTSEDILETDHYYIEFKGNDIVFEAIIDRIE